MAEFEALIESIAGLDARLARKLRPEGECLVYSGYRNQDGYGKVNRGGEAISAHRYLWTLMNGKPAPGIVICHACDNPSCCNPEHLFSGTQADNIADMLKKGRRVKSSWPGVSKPGAQNPNAKLTDDQVRWVRANHNPVHGHELGTGGMARTLGVNRQTILAILKLQTWKEC